MILNEISSLLQKGKAAEVKKKVQEALDQDIEPHVILKEGLVHGMGIIGGKFKKNQVFVPEVLIAARAMNAGLEILRPALVESGNETIGKVLVCTVKGDLHDIGKNLVKMMIEGKGAEVIDLGVDCSTEQVVEAVREHRPGVLCLSALLTTTMMNQKEIIDALDEAGLRKTMKILVGGAPVTQNFADEIGADGYEADAASAADLVVDLLTEAKKGREIDA